MRLFDILLSQTFVLPFNSSASAGHHTIKDTLDAQSLTSLGQGTLSITDSIINGTSPKKNKTEIVHLSRSETK